MTYEECKRICYRYIKQYSKLRDEYEHLDPEKVQDIRDNLSEALIYFGEEAARLRAEAEDAELEKKRYLAERKEYWREQFDGKRGTASLAESNALQDAMDVSKAEIQANKEYYEAKHLIERVDQLINSIASRMKIISKHD